MYRIRLAIVAFLLATIGLQAQEGFYYQAVIKNTDGSPLKETPIKIRIRIIEGETTLQYEEVREITTSREGFISFIIGENASEDFTVINWQGELYLQDEIDTGEGYGAPTRMPLLKTPRSYISDRAISVLDNSITSASILDGSILSDDLSDQSVLTAKLADSLITSTKIARSAVTNTAIASNAISTENVIDSTLTNADISPDAAIDFSKINIPDGSITLEKVNLEEGSIAYSKLIVEEGEIPYSKILVGDSDIAFEKLNITKENINGLGIISNYEGGSNITITDTSIALDDEISLAKVTTNLVGDVLNADEEVVLEVGSSSAAANYTGNVKGNLTGNLLNSNSQTIFTNGSSTVLPKYFGDVYYRESDGSETLILDSKNKIFFGTLEGSLNGNWTGNILGSNNEIILDPITSDGSALFTGNVVGNLTGDVTGDLTGNADTATKIASIDNDNIVQLDAAQTLTNKTLTAPTITEATIDGALTGDLTGDVLAADGTRVLDSGTDGNDATFSGNVTGSLTGNADTATKIASIDNDNIVQLDATQTLTNKTLTAPTITEATIDGALTGDLTGDVLAADGTRVLDSGTDGNDATFSGNVTGSLTGNADTATKIASIDNDNIVQLDATQTLTNKTLTAPTITEATIDGALTGDLTGDVLAADGTRVLDSGTDGNDATFSGNVTGSLTGNADTATKIASIDNDNIVQLDATQTLTNKTLTAPTITEATIDGALTGDLTGDILAADGTRVLDSGTNGNDATFSGNAASASVANKTTITDNEDTNGENALVFTNNSAQFGEVGLESDGDLTYNPSTGTLSATTFNGVLHENSDISNLIKAGELTIATGSDEGEQNLTFQPSTVLVTPQNRINDIGGNPLTYKYSWAPELVNGGTIYKLRVYSISPLNGNPVDVESDVNFSFIAIK